MVERHRRIDPPMGSFHLKDRVVAAILSKDVALPELLAQATHEEELQVASLPTMLTTHPLFQIAPSWVPILALRM